MAWHREEKFLEGIKFHLGADPAGKLARTFGVYNHVAKNPGEVCPANWTDKDPTLKPGAKLVGRVAESLQKDK